ncbi:MAG: hypothetical protein ACSLFL_10175 [Alphaproteobacteria bacterium]
MKNPDNSSRNITSKTDREARQAEALRANLRRRKAFAGKTAPSPETGSTAGAAREPEKPNG